MTPTQMLEQALQTCDRDVVSDLLWQAHCSFYTPRMVEDLRRTRYEVDADNEWELVVRSPRGRGIMVCWDDSTWCGWGPDDYETDKRNWGCKGPQMFYYVQEHEISQEAFLRMIFPDNE
jgi:hypothetical protein